MQKNGNSLKIIAVFLICSLCCYFCRFTILLRYPVLLYVDLNLYAKQANHKTSNETEHIKELDKLVD